MLLVVLAVHLKIFLRFDIEVEKKRTPVINFDDSPINNDNLISTNSDSDSDSSSNSSSN